MFVLVAINVKVSKIIGFSSHGIVLTAHNNDKSKVELIQLQNGSIIGERVFIDGLVGDPYSPAKMKKYKIFQSLCKDLKTDKRRLATWKGMDIKTSSGVCFVSCLEDAYIL